MSIEMGKNFIMKTFTIGNNQITARSDPSAVFNIPGLLNEVKNKFYDMSGTVIPA